MAAVCDIYETRHRSVLPNQEEAEIRSIISVKYPRRLASIVITVYVFNYAP